MADGKVFYSAKNVFIEVNFPDKKVPEDFPSTLKDLGSVGQYTAIIHDRDLKDDGTPKTIHAHIALETNEQQGLKKWLDFLETALKLPRNCISVEAMTNPIGSKRYLWHLDDKEKFQYRDEPMTNNAKAFKDAVNATPKIEPSLEDFEQSKSLKEFTLRVGVSVANKYRSFFNQMKEEEEKERSASKELELATLTIRDLQHLLLELHCLIDRYGHQKKTDGLLEEYQEIMKRYEKYGGLV